MSDGERRPVHDLFSEHCDRHKDLLRERHHKEAENRKEAQVQIEAAEAKRKRNALEATHAVTSEAMTQHLLAQEAAQQAGGRNGPAAPLPPPPQPTVPYAAPPAEEEHGSSDEEDSKAEEQAGEDGPETAAKRQRREARRRKAAATEALHEAMLTRHVKELKSAIDEACRSGHEGETKDSRPWRTEELKAGIKLEAEVITLEERKKASAKEARKNQQALRDFVHAAASLPIRDEPLGTDARGRSYWAFVHDPSRLYVQSAPPTSQPPAAAAAAAAPAPSSSLTRTASEVDRSAVNPAGWVWAYYDTLSSVREVLASLDPECCPEERALKAALRERMMLFEVSMEAEQVVNMDEGWKEEGHEWLGAMMTRVGDAGWISTCKVTRWLPPTEATETSEAEKALFHVVHDDGDEEDLDIDEAEAARKLYLEHEANGTLATSVDAKLARDEYSNKAERRVAARTTPEQLGSSGLRDEILTLEEAICPGLNRIYSPWGTGEGGRTAWLLSARSSSSVVELAQLLMALEQAVRDQVSPGIVEHTERKPWRTDGHPMIGKMARRFFANHGASDGRIVGWLPPEGEDAALWHMVHGDDADEEDLDEIEAAFAIANYKEDRLEPTGEEAAYLAQFEAEAAAARADEPAGEEMKDSDDEEMEEAEADMDYAPARGDNLFGGYDAGTRSGRGERQPRISPGQKVKKPLWVTAESRERWLGTLQGTPTVSAVALAAVALRMHCRDFGLIAESNKSSAKLTRDDIELQLHSWCHATAFGAKKGGQMLKAKKKKGR